MHTIHSSGQGITTAAEGVPATVALTALQPHQCGVMASVEAPDSDLERLMAMAVCGGRTVELVQVGDPLIVKVYGTRVGVSARLGGVAVARGRTVEFFLVDGIIGGVGGILIFLPQMCILFLFLALLDDS